MPSITSAGLGSGLDVTGLVDQLVAAEGEPVRIRLDRKEAKLQSGLSALGTFKGAVSDFQNSVRSLRSPEFFSAMNVMNDNQEAILVTTTREAQAGDYDVEVIQLAQTQKLASVAFDSDVEPLGTGGLSIQLGRYNPDKKSFSSNPDITPANIIITNTNSSLRGIAEAINESSAAVRASVINDGSGFRLVISALMEGLDNSIRMTVLDDDGNNIDKNGLSNFVFDMASKQISDADFTAEDAAKLVSGGLGAVQVFTDDDQKVIGLIVTNMSETVAGQDAIINVDGLNVTRSQNELNDVINGINLELQPGSEGKISSLNVTLSTDEVRTSINEFINKYNELVSTAKALTGYDPETGVAGPLSGDASVRSVSNQVRRVLSQSFSSINNEYDTLSSIGIDTDRNGLLSIDDAQLANAIDTNLQEIVQLFATAGSANDPLIEYVGADETTTPGSYNLVVTQLAAHGLFSGVNSGISSVDIDSGSNKLQIKVDGQFAREIEVTPGKYESLEEIGLEIQQGVANDELFSRNDIRLSTEVEGGQLILKSDSFGINSSIEIISIDSDLAKASGLFVGAGQPGQNVQGTFNNQAALGSGKLLTGEGVAAGLSIQIEGGVVGERGNVIYSNGIASQLNTLLSRFNDGDGLFNSRTNGFKDRISDINHQREQLANKLERSEKRYTKQFSSLDALVGKMRTTGEYLERQLSVLPGTNGSRKK